MDALVRAVCPTCHAQGDVPSKFVGHNIRCRKCGTNFAVQAPKAGSALDDLSSMDEIPLAPETEEELAHEERVKAKLIGQMKHL
jgi:hypothetical protein